LVWKRNGKDPDGREAFRARAGRGYYQVSPAKGDDKFFTTKYFVGDKQRTITPSSV